jgi:hypothetical protein
MCVATEDDGIHGHMKYFQLSRLTFAFVAAVLLSLQTNAKAGGEGFSRDTLSDAKDTVQTNSDVGLGKFAAFPFHVSVTVRGGYDDNVNLTSFNERGSAFTNAALGLIYDFGNARTKINLNAGVSATYYWDQGNEELFGANSQDFVLNAYAGFSITHKATPRLTFAAI